MRSFLPFLLLVIFLINHEWVNGASLQQFKGNNHPTKFIENKGQIANKNVLFQLERKAVSIYLTTTGLTYNIHVPKKIDAKHLKNTEKEALPNKDEIIKNLLDRKKSTQRQNGISFLRIDVNLIGALIDKKNIECSEIATDKAYNYFTPSVKDGVYGIHQVATIRIKNIFYGVDWILHATDSSFEYSFELQPNANPHIIQLQYVGADKIEIDSVGNLILKNKLLDLIETKPIGLQLKEATEVNFKNKMANIFTFESEKRKEKLPLLIDPKLVWSTAFVGSNWDYYSAITTDQFNNFFLTGETSSFPFPLVNAGTYFDDTLGGYEDIVIAKFDDSCKLVWSTYYGGVGLNYYGEEFGTAVKCDHQGNVFITGTTFSNDFPLQNGGMNYMDTSINGSYVSALNFISDAFLLKFSNNGTRIFCTFFGGNNNDYATDLDIDPAGNVVIVGNTASSNFPLQSSSGYFQAIKNGVSDAFISKFNNSGALLWSTYFGGDSDEVINTISCDKTGNIFVAGDVDSSTTFPLLNNGNYFQNTFKGADDGFVAKFNSSNSLVWSTLYGGSGWGEEINSSVIDNNNNLIIGGWTAAKDFPLKNLAGAYTDTTISAKPYSPQVNFIPDWLCDGFLVKFDNNGGRKWASFLGGNGYDCASTYPMNYIGSNFYYAKNDMLVADDCGNFYFSLSTNSSDMPCKIGGCNSFFDTILNIDEVVGGYGSLSDNNFYNRWDYSNDIFLSKFNSSCKLVWGTYFGGSGAEDAMTMALNVKNDIVGITNVGDYAWTFLYQPFYPNSYFNTFQYLSGPALLRFNQSQFTPDVSYSSCSGNCNGSAAINVNSQCTQNAFKYLWSNGGTTANQNNLCNGHYSVVIKDTLTCAVDTFKFTLYHGIQATPTLSAFSCPSTCDGKAMVNIPGATNLNISWHTVDTTYNNVNAIQFICPGNDTLYVSEAGCGSDTVYFNLAPPPPLVAILKGFYSGSQASCPILCDGIAQIEINGGEKNPYCIWSNGVYGTQINNLCPGHNYLAIISDSGCYSTIVSITMPPANSEYASQWSELDYMGHCDSSTLLSGYLSYSHDAHYKWSTGDTTVQVHKIPPGNYWCYVYDSCFSDTLYYQVQPRQPLTGNIGYQFKPCSSDSCTGKISVGINNNYYIANYHTLWSNGVANVWSIDSICYDSIKWVLITNDCGDSLLLDSIIFYHYPTLGLIWSVTPSCPNICNGSASISADGDLPPYSFVWSNGTTGVVDGYLCGDSTYYVVCTDGCGVTDTAFMQIPKTSIPQANISVGTECPGMCNGSAYIYPLGGMAPYNYVWSNGAPNTFQIFNLCAGNYYCKITDYCNLSDTVNFTITSIPQLNASVQVVDIPCSQTCNVSAFLNITYGAAPFHYHWSNGNTSGTVSNLCHNTNYSVILNDGGCGTDTFYFTTPPQVLPLKDSIISSTICPNSCNGIAGVILENGMPPYFWTWNNNSNDSVLNNLCVGTYTCFATDMCGKLIYDTIKVSPALPLKLIDTILHRASCSNSCNNSAVINISGGNQQYIYSWSNGNATDSAYNLCPGNYSVIVTNPSCNSDTIRHQFFIPNSINISSSVLQKIKCYDSCNAAISIAANGGVAPILFSWSNGTNDSINKNLCAGTYVVTVTDNSGCTRKDTFQITQPSQIFVDTSLHNPHCNRNDGQIIATASGGTSPYLFHWSNGVNNSMLNNVAAGNYSLTVTDSNGCKMFENYQINNQIFQIKTSNDTAVQIGNQVSLNVSGGQKYLWYSATNLNCDTCHQTIWNGFQNETVCVIGKDVYGCVDSSCVNISVFGECGNIAMPNAFTPNNDGINDVYKPIPNCINSLSFSIYDRWGKLMFATNDINAGWDGKYKGENMPIGVYVWTIEAMSYSNKKINMKGNVTLIR